MSKNIAVILSGCGFLDGAEIRESVLTLLALDMEGVEYKIFAPNKDQHHVVNHLRGEESTGESRNTLVESARIARGKIQDINELNASDFDALVMPGGFGVAKNLCDFAFKGSAGQVDPKVLEIVKSFSENSKPIGAICIAPAMVALSLGEKNPKLTIGNDEATASEIEKLGAKHINCDANECIVDKERKIVTTPAYMYDDAKLNDILSGIHKTVKEVISLI